MSGAETWTAYVELTKPRIILLLLLVAASSYVVSAPSAFSPTVLATLLGAGALTSAGSSALNHYLDRDIDVRMARTRRRPLPTGRLQPHRALLFGIALVSGGVLLSIPINLLTSAFILLGVVVYVGVYTVVLKRRTRWNIVIGGFAGSCPALAGSAAAVGGVTLPGLLLALLVFLWTPGHFWALGLRNRDDYVQAEIPMLPAVVPTKAAAKSIVASTALLTLYLPLFYAMNVVTIPSLVIVLAAGVVLLYLTTGVLRDSKAAWSSFKFSGLFLTVTLLVVAADALVSLG